MARLVNRMLRSRCQEEGKLRKTSLRRVLAEVLNLKFSY